MNKRTLLAGAALCLTLLLALSGCRGPASADNSGDDSQPITDSGSHIPDRDTAADDITENTSSTTAGRSDTVSSRSEAAASNTTTAPAANIELEINVGDWFDEEEPTTKIEAKTGRPTTTGTISRPTTTAAGTTTTTKPRSVTTQKAAATPSEQMAEVLRLVNEERAKQGLAALTYHSAAQSAADIRAGEIVGTFSHTRPDGSTCFTALDQAGVTYRAAGENIAQGYRTPAEVMNGWMNSDGHRGNILDPDFNAIVIGVEGTSWVQLFLTV